jgi:hypothetical protein
MEIELGVPAHSILRVNGKAIADACDKPLTPAVLVYIPPDRAMPMGA